MSRPGWAVPTICALIAAAPLHAQARAGASSPRVELEALLPALPDTARPIAHAVLTMPPGSTEQIRAASALARLSEQLKGRTVPRRFFELLATTDPTPEVRRSAIDAMYSQTRGTPEAAPRLLLRTAARTDTSSLVRIAALRALSNVVAHDSVSWRTYQAALMADSAPEVRQAGLWLLQWTGLPDTTIKSLLLARIAVEADSNVAMAGIETYRQFVRDTALGRVLQARVARDGGVGAPRWLAAAHQQAADAGRWKEPTVLPWFMREPPPVFAALPDTASAIRFFAIGDWADGNNEDQQAMSAAVRAAHRREPFDFGLTTGDNFYPSGLATPRSPRWATEYEQQYGVMDIPIYATLGNHDFYQSDAPAAEIAYTGYSTTWKLPATHYTFTAGAAQFFVLDTESLTPWQLGWLDSALAASTAPWKIVVGHYDLYSDRADGTDGKAKLLVPIFQRHQVPVYLNGHYHTLQHYQVDGTDYVTSGGGGRVLYPVDSTAVDSTRKFAAKSFGFAELEVTPARFGLRFRDTAGTELYRYERRK